MKLKCIGGKCDGQSLWVDTARYRLKDCVNVPKQIEISAEFFDPNKAPELMEISYDIYEIDCLKYSHSSKSDVSEIWFLRPRNLTTFDAIQFQFLK